LPAQPVAGDDDLAREIGANDGGGSAQCSHEARGNAILRERVRHADDETAAFTPTKQCGRSQPGVEVDAADPAVELDLLTVTATGIETAAQLVTLQTLGCDHGQGYSFARPMASAAMAEHLRSRTTETRAAPSPRLLALSARA
jgi:hypothetical protein